MKFEVSPNIAVYVPDLKQAKHYYAEVLGFEEVPTTERWVEFKSGPNRLFIMEDKTFNKNVHELFVQDLDKAKMALLAAGCQIVRWEGKGKDCYIKDPYGMYFNVWEK